MTGDKDIVYILKNDIKQKDELIFSLRSVCESFPHRFVWFVGGCPDGLTPDRKIEHQQTGGSKWERARSSLLLACKCQDITEEFFLFNDDFFILKEPQGEFINMTNGTIGRRVAEIVTNNRGGSSAYSRGLEDLAGRLRRKGKDTMSFALHVPMLINRRDMYELLTSRDTHHSFRSLYGNYYRIPYIFHEDCKIYTMTETPGKDWEYLSTTEQSFAFGAVGEWIRDRFPNPCKFEEV